MNRQYIGARYVPKIYENSVDPSSMEWEENTAYEPLTEVTYRYSSFISKKAVPNSVGNPSENPTYWAETGAYNGQIAELQNEVSAINTEIGTLKKDVVKSNLTNKNILFVMDSYGGRTTTSGDNVAEAIADATGATTHLTYQNGASLTQFTTLVTNYSGDHDDINTIVLIGGANDQASSYADIVTGMTAFISACKSNYDNLENIYVFCPGLTFSSNQYPQFTVENRESLWRGYKDGAVKNGAIYVDNSQYIFRNTTLLDTDYCHPNNTGMDTLVNYIIDGLINGIIDVHYYLTTSYTHDGVSMNYKMTRDNGVCTITNGRGLPAMVQCNAIADATGSNLNTYGSFSESLIDNYSPSGLNDLGCLATYFYNDNMYFGRASIVISEKVAKGYVQQLDNNNATSGTTFMGIVSTLTLHN